MQTWASWRFTEMRIGIDLSLQSVLGKGSNTPPPAFASGVLSFDGNVNAGETITIGETIYTLVPALLEAYDVMLGSSASLTINNLIAAVTAGPGEGTIYGTGTVEHPDVTASAAPGVMNVTAKVAGTEGNAIVTEATTVNATWGAATLQGGA
jgi:hypothetical protein